MVWVVVRVSHTLHISVGFLRFQHYPFVKELPRGARLCSFLINLVVQSELPIDRISRDQPFLQCQGKCLTELRTLGFLADSLVRWVLVITFRTACFLVMLQAPRHHAGNKDGANYRKNRDNLLTVASLKRL